MAGQINSAERIEIEQLDQQEAQAMLVGDISALQRLWADDLVVNSTANLIASKQILLEMISKGLLRLRVYERRPVRIARFNSLAISTGSEISQVTGKTLEFKLLTSYMNVWAKRAAGWQLIARHVGMIERSRAVIRD